MSDVSQPRNALIARILEGDGRAADAFGFFVPGPEVFEAGAKVLRSRGYG